MFDLRMPVRDVMTDRVITVEPTTVMTDVAEIFKMHQIHHIPVVDDGKVVGMISTSEVNRLEHHFTLFKSSQAAEVNAAIFGSLLAREVMTAQVVIVRDTDTVQFAADIFKENLFRALPVVDGQKRLVGILTPYDLMVYAYRPESLSIK